jgi:hypothetical protein
MSISQAQYIDLLVKKLYGVATTDNAENKSPSNESITSPDLNRGDTLWTQADQIPDVAANIANLSFQYGNTNPVQCTPDTTSVPILNAFGQPIYPTWLTNATEWIPPEFGGSYSVQAYVGPANISNLSGANVTFISSSGEGNAPNPGEFFFDYQAGLLYFIGETIPNVLTTGNVVYITGYQYTGLTGVTNLPNNSNIGNINITATTISSIDINGNLVAFGGNSGIVLPSGNSTQRPSNALIGTTRFNTTIDSIETWDGAAWITGGNTVTPGTITDQQIIPDGTSNTFTLDQTTSSAGILVSINGVTQVPTVSYTVTGNSITFTQTPLTEDLIDIRYISYTTTVSALTNSSGNASITVTPAGNILFTTNGNVVTTMSANAVAIAGGLSTTGNITTSGYFIGTFAGNVSGNVVAPGSNTQVLYNNGGNLAASAGFTFDQGSNAMAVAGNVTGANISTGGRISANGNIVGGNISGTNISGNLTSGAQANITSVGTLTSLNVNGNINSGNISASLVNTTTINAVNIGNSSTEFSGADLSVTGNVIGANLVGTIQTANQSSITTVGTLTNLSVAGNVIAGSLIGEGGNLSNITAANINGTVANANTAVTAYSVSGANVTGTVATASAAGTVTTNAQPNITSVGTLTSLNVNGAVSATGDLHTEANILGNGIISTTGNVTGLYFFGNGSQLSGIASSYGNSNVASYLPTYTGILNPSSLSASGNVRGSYILGNGSQLTGLPASYSNSNVASYLPIYSGNLSAGNVSITDTITGNSLNIVNISSTGSIVGAIISTTGNITAPYFVGNLIGNISGNITVPGSNTQIIYNNNGQANASPGLTFDFNSNALVSTGTVTGSNFLTGGFVSASGNVIANYFIGSGATLNNITAANIVGAVANATYATTTGTAATITTNAQPNITSVGTLSSLVVTGNATAGNLLSGGSISTTGNITTAGYFIGTFQGNVSGNLTVPGSNTQVLYNNSGNAGASAGLTFDAASNSLVSTGTITGSNFLTGGYASAAGNIITNNHFIGNGSTLNNITGANVTGTVANATYATSSGTSGTVTTNAQPNITSVGILTSLSVSGTATPGNLITAGIISAAGNISTAGYFVGNFQGNVSGNITVPGSNTQLIYNNNGNAGASAGLTFNSGTNALISTGTVTGSNFLTGGFVSASGNVIGSQFIGSGNTLSNIQGANVNGTVANATYAVSSGYAATVTTNAQPNITSTGTLSTLSVSGTTTTGNLLTDGLVSASGNITSNGYFIGTFLGNISGNLTVPGVNTQVIYNNNGNAGASSGFTFNAGTNTLSVSGNATLGNILSNGTISAAGNATVGNINATNHTGTTLSITGNVTGSQFFGSGNTLSNIQGANVTGNVSSAIIAGTVTTNAQSNITSVGVLTSLSISGNTTTSGAVSATGNISTAGYFVGNFLGNVTGNITVPGSNTQVIYNANGNAGASAGFTFNAGTNALVSTGTITGSNLLTGGTVSAAGNIFGGNINVTNHTGTTVSVTGTVTGSQFIGSGNALSNIQGANVSGTVTTATVSGTVTTNAQSNITSVGVLTSLSSTGNISGNYFIGNGSQLTGVVATSVGNLTNLSVTGNITVGGNIFGNSGNLKLSANVSETWSTWVINNDTAAGPNNTALVVPYSNTVNTGEILFQGTGGDAQLFWDGNPADGVLGNAFNILTNQGNIVLSTFDGAAFYSSIFDTTGNLTLPGNLISSGNLLPNANVTYTLGSSTRQWKTLYVSGNTIYIGGSNITSNGNTLSVNGNSVVTANTPISGDVLTTGNISATGTIKSNANVITVAVSGGTGAAINGAGLVAGANVATLLYDNSVFGWTINQGFHPSANTTYNLGRTTRYWNNLYSVNVNATDIAVTNSVSATGNIIGGNLSVGLGTITVNNIINGGSSATGNIGSATAPFDTIFAQATSAQYADLAEKYISDAEYSPGTVVSFGGEAEVTISNVDSDRKIAGVISTNPSYTMNSGLAGNTVTVALTGRVPTSVTGQVRKGDMMVSNGDGTARTENNPQIGSVIGKALADFDGETGVIEVVVGRL